MKKILSILIAFILGVLLSVQVYCNIKEDNESNDCSASTTSVSFDSIAMILETGEGTGQYSPSTSSEWPSIDEYTFNETASKCENGSSLSWDSENNQVLMYGTSSDRCYIYFDKVTVDTFADYIISLYTEDGTNNMYYFDGEGTYANADLEANDKSYRYSGASASTYNYVCFGGDDCSDVENLYRIIGVFLNDDGEYEVKLMKAEYCTSSQCGTDGDYYGTYSAANSTWSYLASTYYKGTQEIANFGSYYWNSVNYSTSYSESSYYNNWTYSELNTVNLNTNYLEYLGDWNSMITTHTWSVGGGSTENISTNSNALITYVNEVLYPTTTQVDSTYNGKIGLIYISDYYYATSPTYWSYVGYDSSNSNDYRVGISYNWMYLGIFEWTITRTTMSSSQSFNISHNGSVVAASSRTINGRAFAIRPTFYLDSSVKYVDGDGSYDNPYQISLD